MKYYIDKKDNYIINQKNFNTIENLSDKSAAKVGHACSSKASHALTKVLQFFGAREDYWTEHGNKLLTAYEIRKNFQPVNNKEKPLLKKIHNIWKQAQIEPQKVSATNFIEAERLLDTYDKKKLPTHPLLDELKVKDAVNKVKDVFFNPVFDKSIQRPKAQEEALKRLALIDRAKKAYDALPDDKTKQKFLLMVKETERNEQLFGLMDAYDKIQRDGSPHELIDNLEKIYQRPDLNTISQEEDFFGIYIQVDKQALIRKLEAYPLLKEVLETKIQAAGDDDLKTYLALITGFEDTLKDEHYTQETREKLLKGAVQFIKSSTETSELLKFTQASNRVQRIAQALSSPERQQFFINTYIDSALFDPSELNNFEKMYVQARTRDRIELLQIPVELPKNLKESLEASFLALNNDDDKELAFIRSFQERLGYIRDFREKYGDEALIRHIKKLEQLPESQQRLLGSDLRLDMRDLEAIKQDIQIETFLNAVDERYSNIVKRYFQDKTNVEKIQFLNMKEVDKLKILKINEMYPKLPEGFVLAIIDIVIPQGGAAVIRELDRLDALEIEAGREMNYVSRIASNKQENIYKTAYEKLQKEATIQLSDKVLYNAITQYFLAHPEAKKINGVTAENEVLAHAFRAWVVERGQIERGTENSPTDDQLYELAEELFQNLPDPLSFSKLNANPNLYFQKIIAIAVQEMKKGAQPNIIGKELGRFFHNHNEFKTLEMLNKRNTVNLTETTETSLRNRFNLSLETNISIQAIMSDIENDPICFLDVIINSAFKGILRPEDHAGITSFSKAFLDAREAFAPYTSLLKELKILDWLTRFNVTLSHEKIKELKDQIFDGLIDATGAKPGSEPSGTFKTIFDKLLPDITKELEKPDFQNKLKYLPWSFPFIQTGVKLVPYIEPVLRPIITVVVTKGLNFFIDYVAKQQPPEGTAENKAAFVQKRDMHVKQLQELIKVLPTVIPLISKALVQVVKNHPKLLDEIKTLISAAISNPKTGKIDQEKLQQAIVHLLGVLFLELKEDARILDALVDGIAYRYPEKKTSAAKS